MSSQALLSPSHTTGWLPLQDVLTAFLYQTLFSPSPTTGWLPLQMLWVLLSIKLSSAPAPPLAGCPSMMFWMLLSIIICSAWLLLLSAPESLTKMEEYLTGVEESLTRVEESLTGVEESLNGVEESLTGMEEDLCWVYKAGMTNTKNPPVPAELIIAAQTRQSGSEHITCENCRTQPGQGRGWRWTWGTWWGSWWSQASLCGRNLKYNHSFFFFTFFLNLLHIKVSVVLVMFWALIFL